MKELQSLLDQNKVSKRKLLAYLSKELDQTIAVILMNLDDDTAKTILLMFDNSKQADILEHINYTKEISIDILREIERVICREFEFDSYIALDENKFNTLLSNVNIDVKSELEENLGIEL